MLHSRWEGIRGPFMGRYNEGTRFCGCAGHIAHYETLRRHSLLYLMGWPPQSYSCLQLGVCQTGAVTRKISCMTEDLNSLIQKNKTKNEKRRESTLHMPRLRRYRPRIATISSAYLSSIRRPTRPSRDSYVITQTFLGISLSAIVLQTSTIPM